MPVATNNTMYSNKEHLCFCRFWHLQCALIINKSYKSSYHFFRECWNQLCAVEHSATRSIVVLRLSDVPKILASCPLCINHQVTKLTPNFIPKNTRSCAVDWLNSDLLNKFKNGTAPSEATKNRLKISFFKSIFSKTA